MHWRAERLVDRSLSSVRAQCDFWITKRYKEKGRNRQDEISEILGDPRSPEVISDEHVFMELQGRFEPRPEYGYDSRSIFLRAAQRSITLLGLSPSFEARNLRVLEVACGDGMVGTLLSLHGCNVNMIDGEDWRDERSKETPFVLGDVCQKIDFPENTFDLVFSFNAFEHFPDPGKAFSEILRVCKPGGHIYLDFDPLYASPWGLHAYRTLRMPYPQYLFCNSLLKEMLNRLGIVDLGSDRSELQSLNAWKVSQFRALWENRCKILDYGTRETTEFLNIVKQYPACFRGRQLNFDDLTISGIRAHLQKPM